ncbi:MAG TPA: glycosyltransferase family 39 protein [Longimicrobiales bacterium]|nr:glycosyltransferase family 39 protein [Longimicrobiales bacterium]
MRFVGSREREVTVRVGGGTWLPTLAVVSAGAALRLWGSGGWWLNPDEGIYWATVTRDRFADFWGEAMATAHPPLYFLLLRAMALVSTDFDWLRSLALVSGVATIYVLVLLGREIGGAGRRGLATGLASGLLVALSPRAVALSQVVRPYALLLLLLASALYLLLRSMREPSRGALAGYALSTSLALTLHYSAVLALGVFGALVLARGATSGFRKAEWRRLAWVQLAPALTLVGMYAWHLRGLVASDMAGYALDGWLSSYLIRDVADVWLGVVGAHSSLVGDPLAAAATLVTVAGLVWAASVREWRVVTLGAAAVLLAVLAAALGAYPIGASRHAAWLLVFLTPVLAWTLMSALTLPVRLRAAALAIGALLIVGMRPLSAVLDSERRPREISERVLRVEHVEAMAQTLAPETGPRLLIMSTETYTLLSPLYRAERQRAEATRDRSLLRLRWGRRDVLVFSDRDFLALPQDTSRANHLLTVARQGAERLGVTPPGDGEHVLVLAGGWRSQGVEDLIELAQTAPGLGTSTHVPGLIAVELDFTAYRRALGLGDS